ncbi:MAG TPA: hypothetical protein VIM12_20750 [Noviherbaspirillum sp.]|jgi:hypothetical protein|uniref:hypothetical protein n=1 Tax=Noviherbaspirillum sp. TaxID=1926288 RepID=UPI002F930094
MQTLTYRVGTWQAEARLEELEPGRLMAVISVVGAEGRSIGSSRHTIVFDHPEGQDKQARTRMLVQRLLQERYGL